MAGANQQPLALVRGEAYDTPPPSLYIPAAALRVSVQDFEGPLDVLLYLVRKHRLDILNINMGELCRQYAAYARAAVAADIETTADYLAMSAMLLEIKTRMMLPRLPQVDDDEEDPRADLVRRLLEYERIRAAAAELAQMPRRGRDFVSPQVVVAVAPPEQKPQLRAEAVATAMAAVLRRYDEKNQAYTVARELVSVREVMSNVIRFLREKVSARFRALAKPRQGGVTFVALLQLSAEGIVTLRQEDDDVLVKMRGQTS